MGTAETPAAPIRGLILPFVTIYSTLPISTPPAVEQMQAVRPSTTISSVLSWMKSCPFAVAPTHTPSMMVTMFISAFCAVSDRRSTTPDSRNRLPSMNMPSSGTTEGRIRAMSTSTTIGKMIFSVFETFLSCVILTFRSFSVVSSFMIGGWMIGISAM